MTVTKSLSGTVCHSQAGTCYDATINMHTKFEVSSLSCSRDISGGLKILTGSGDVTNPHTKFDMSI